MMDQTTLLIGASVAAGAHMVLFGVAASLAWMYFKRCKKLKAQLAQYEMTDGQEDDDRREDRDARRSASDHTDDHRRSRDGNRHRESTAGKARRERRHQRDRERRPRDESSPYAQDDPSDYSTAEERRDGIRMSRLNRQDTKTYTRDHRRSTTV